MTSFFDYFRKKAGLCPHSSKQKIPTFTGQIVNDRIPEMPHSPAAPPASTVVTIPADSRPAYQENLLLILLLLAGLFCLIDLKMLAFAGIFSALLVYYDARTLHAGEKFEKESILGDVVTWRPLTWALAVLIIPLIFLAIYVFSRKEIFAANA